MTHAVREATAADADSVIRLLDAAMLSFDRERTRRRAADGDVVVAVVRGHSRAERRGSNGDDARTDDDRVVGACVLGESNPGGTEIEQIAVHRSRRGRGIGTSLVASAAARADGPLVARFRADVRPFYESLGFEIDAPEPTGDDPDGAAGRRLRGILR